MGVFKDIGVSILHQKAADEFPKASNDHIMEGPDRAAQESTPSQTGATDGKPSQFRTPSARNTGLIHALLSHINHLNSLQSSAYVTYAAALLIFRGSGASGSSALVNSSAVGLHTEHTRRPAG